MHPRHATQETAGRLFMLVLASGVVFGIWAACTACQAPMPVSPDMRCEFDPGCGATDYPAVDVGGVKDSGTE